MSIVMRLVAGFVLAVLTIACGGPVPVAQRPSESQRIAHATGATDVVLRFDREGGGFSAPMILAVWPSDFTLYGDGTIIFHDLAMDSIPMPVGTAQLVAPLRIATLDEAQVQDLLTSALGDAGLGTARPEYRDARFARKTSALFTLDFAGIRKTVAVDGLDADVSDGPDVEARRGFARFAARLRAFDADGPVPSQPYVPTRYRGLLFEAPERLDFPTVGGAVPWPWDDLRPSDFIRHPEVDRAAFHVLTAEQVRALGLGRVDGGFGGLWMTDPTGTLPYRLNVRPLLPHQLE